MDNYYRYLKSIIGDTADLLALQRELKIRKGKIILDTPPDNISNGEITIGNISNNKQFRISKNELTNHLIVAGRSGSGKTNTSFQIISSLIKEKIPLMIFDWKKTHRNLHEIFPEIKIFTLGRNINPFFFNPLIPPPGMNPRNWALSLSQIWESSSLLGPGASHLLLRAFDFLYKNFGVYENHKTEIYPTMHDLLSYLESMNIKSYRESLWLSSAKRAVQNICFGDSGKALNVRKYYSIHYLEKILHENIILELESLTHSGKIFFIYSLLLWLHHYSLNTHERGKLKRALIIEECYHLLSKDFHRNTSTEDVLENLLRESREFGTAFIMLFQTVSNIPNTALSNIHTIISHNLVHSQDLRAMAGILLLNQQEQNYISQLKVGEAIVKLQSRYAKPFLITVPYFNIIRDRILSDNEIKSKKASYSFNSYGIPSSNHEKPSYSSSSFPRISIDECAFLLSVLQKPFLSTSTRYKELGFYINKANAIKNKFLKLKLISEISIQLSQKKTIKLLHLTPIGKSVLRENNYNSEYKFENKGGLEHAFWVYIIKNILQKNNYTAYAEKSNIDLIATRTNEKIAIEVETGNSYPTKNILKCLQMNFTKVISVATNQETFMQIRNFINYYKLQSRVKLILAKDILESDFP